MYPNSGPSGPQRADYNIESSLRVMTSNIGPLRIPTPQKDVYNTPLRPPQGQNNPEKDTPESKGGQAQNLLVNKSIYSDLKSDISKKYYPPKCSYRGGNEAKGITTTDMLKIIALKNECMHKVGIIKLNEIDNDILILEKAIKEEDSHIDVLKHNIVNTSDVDGSNFAYRNNLKFHSTQPLGTDTQSKIKSYLSEHLSNFKPHNKKTIQLIEQIKSQNAEIIKKNGRIFDKNFSKPIQNFELIEEKKQERKNKYIKEKLNLTVLPNLNQDTKIFMDLDVQYDFIPTNEEYLRRMRLDFISKKDKVVNFIRKSIKTKAQKEIFYHHKFDHDYLEWSKRVSKSNESPSNMKKGSTDWHSDLRQKDGDLLKEILEKDSAIPTEDFTPQLQKTQSKRTTNNSRGQWMDKKKDHDEDEEGYDREIELFRKGKAHIIKANYNHYKQEFFGIEPTHKSILDLIRYDYDYKSSDIWSLEDIRNFMVQYLNYPKDFNKITSFFNNKTNKDIVNFYFNFKFHFQLVKHVMEIERPKYRELKKSGYPSRSTAYNNYAIRPNHKKIEYINQAADEVIKEITSKYYQEYEDYSQSKFGLPVTKFTTFQLMKIFSNSSSDRNNLQTKHKKREQMYEEAKKRSNTECVKLVYRPPNTDIGPWTCAYFDEVMKNGEEVEAKLLSNFQPLKQALDARESQILTDTQKFVLNSKRLTDVVPQRKIFDRINSKTKNKKQEEITMQEDNNPEDEEDIENYEEGYQGRYQPDFLLLEKNLSCDSEMAIESDKEETIKFSNSAYDKVNKATPTSKNNDSEQLTQTYEMGISTSHAYMRENKPQIKKTEAPFIPNKSFNHEDLSIRSSSIGHEKVNSTSSMQRSSKYPKPQFSRTASERKSMAHWIEPEKEEFKKQLSIHGKDWKRISDVITNKTEKQIRNFYQNYKKKLKLEELLPARDKLDLERSNEGQSPKNMKSSERSYEPKKKSNYALENTVHKGKKGRPSTKSASPFKKRSKRRKIESSENESEPSLEEVKESQSESSSSSEEENRKRVAKAKRKDATKHTTYCSLCKCSKPCLCRQELISQSSSKSSSSSEQSSQNSDDSSQEMDNDIDEESL
ncbi:unnamed protein product [Moneuplotes crassus]|uniref:Uncharacterized protein n=2 Tax=Euplotes crassus TaxID=5936 RepID=A0AAD1XI67_EUPCR|nr:unnamed protein product [Moneuplotes crassus]